MHVYPDHPHPLLRVRGFGWQRTAMSMAQERPDPDAYEAKVGELPPLNKRRRLA
ncbi:MAG: hypothetical protein M3R02_13660 [Chloroflexota bacterium]|nr:hypothetical protein [Chloroflexota bacterium]